MAGTLLATMAGCARAPEPVPVVRAPAQSPAAWNASFAPDDAAMTDAFLRLALGSEVIHGPREPRLLRFAAPVRIALAGDTAEETPRLLDWLAAQLAHVTGHDIAPAATGARANLLVLSTPAVVTDLRSRHAALAAPYFISREAMARTLAAIEAGRPLCWFTIRPARDGAIESALVVVPSSLRGPALWRCLVEEVAQALGLPDDDAGWHYSVFNDGAPWLDLTRPDQLMLRALYHPALRPGMSEAELRARLPALWPGVRQSLR